MERDKARNIIEKFIKEELARNENDVYKEEYPKLYTSQEREFIIYKKNQEKSIYVKPKNGEKNFSESIDRILDYYIDNNTNHHSDKSYVVPIAEYIFRNISNTEMQRQSQRNLKIKNIMLYGAPGVGKTYNYKRLISLIEEGKTESEIFNIIKEKDDYAIDEKKCKKIEDEKRVEFVSFHQSYSYEDFIEGFRPNESGNIELEDGIFKVLCNKALKQEEKNFYIVIDEINRGNISKIFGELITLIEEDKRDNLEVTLPYSKEKFKIPSNLYIIATMNSTDKSIATIDIALRRRFTFLKMSPKPKLVKDTNAKELMEKLNVFIKETRGEDFMLGHSYFMSGLDLEFVKEYKIKPLLEEYFYGDEENYKKALDILGRK